MVGIGADASPAILGRMLTERRASGIDDLRIAVASMSAAWRAGAPHIAGTPAAIEWWYALTHPAPLSEHLRLWYDDDALVGWAWHEPPELEVHVWTGDAVGDGRVFATIVDAALDEHPDDEVAAFARDGDDEAVRILLDRGCTPAGQRLSQWQWRADGQPPSDVVLPVGYRIRGLRGPEEFDARVALHRAAFPASRLNVAKYERLLTVPHYRLEDDLVVETSDGSLAAFALCWYDPDGRVGELEPVGTHPDHQRRGLSRAVVTAAVRRLFQRGADRVQAYSDQAESAPEALYGSVGFARHATHQRYVVGPRHVPDATIGT
jgi:ribosomal protein S18 acetylase RimI-like enzyme